MKKLEQIVDITALSKEERMKYDESIKVYRDNLATLEFAKEEGRAKGLMEGHAKGLAEGMSKEKYALAKGFKEAGTPSDIIAQVTGLSEEEINTL